MNIRKVFLKILIYIGAILLFLWTVLPIGWMFISSISPQSDLLTKTGHFLPSNITFERYKSILGTTTMKLRNIDVKGPGAIFKKSVLNSLIVALSTTLACLIIGGFSSYAFARLKFPMKNKFLLLAIFFQLIPPISIIIPLFLILKKFAMTDKLISLIIIYTSFTLAYVIWIMTGYFKTISPDLESAARIDGCSRIGAFARVLVPIAAPGFTAVGILVFFVSWNEFMFALIFTNSSAAKTITVAITEFSTQYGIDYGMTMTAGCIAAIIPIVLALAFQRFIALGLTSGGVKE